jgi:hypothetical protein
MSDTCVKRHWSQAIRNEWKNQTMSHSSPPRACVTKTRSDGTRYHPWCCTPTRRNPTLVLEFIPTRLILAHDRAIAILAIVIIHYMSIYKDLIINLPASVWHVYRILWWTCLWHTKVFRDTCLWWHWKDADWTHPYI